MAKKKRSSPSATYSEKVAAELKRKHARRGLGLQPQQSLPRCGHKLVNKIKRFEEDGDFSHSAKDHHCPECTCQHIGGAGTGHTGVGWCWIHEKCHSNKDCDERVQLMTNAIRAGFPEKAYQYVTGNEILKKIQQGAEDANGVMSLKEQHNLMISMSQEMLTVWETGSKSKGKRFTESGKNGPVDASDATIVEIIGKMIERIAKMSRIELEITDSDYVHYDELKIYMAKVMQVVNKVIDDDAEFNKVLLGLAELNEPGRGRRKRK